MEIDADRFHRILHAVIPGIAALSADDATAIAQICDLAAHVDLDEDRDELAALDAFAREVCATANIPRERVPVVSPLPVDDEERCAWITQLADRLTTPGARELAYVAANLLAVSDLEIAPVEQRMLDQMRSKLGLSEDRARDLVATAAEIVTPGASELGQ
jgi:hypothetical protein